MATADDFPSLNGSLKTFMSDGSDIGIEFETATGPVRVSVSVGDLPMVMGKLFTAAAEAGKRRGEPEAVKNLTGDIRAISAIRDPKIYVANSIGPSGQGRVGVIMEISGIPFTAAVTPDVCLRLAEDLQSAVKEQSTQSQRKPN